MFKVFLFSFLITAGLFFAFHNASASHVWEILPPGGEDLSCLGSGQACGTSCSNSFSVIDLSDRYISQAWRGSHRAWDDKMETQALVNGIDFFSESKTSPGCDCGSGCAGEDFPGPITFFTGAPGQTSISMSVTGIQLNNRDVNLIAAKVAYGVARTICHTDQKAENGACVPIVGDINLPSASCTEPCNVLVNWSTNSHKKVDIYKDGSLLWTVFSPSGNQADSGLRRGTYRYCVRGYGGSDVQTADLDCGSVTVNPPLPGRILTVTKSGNGSGLVTSNPSGIDCGSTCSSAFASGATVTLTAFPSSDSVFSGWGGDADCTDGSITMSADKTCTATFNLNGGVTKTRVLNIEKSGTGSGTVTSNPAGINCGGVCSYSFLENTVVSLSASPSSGSAFGGWSGDTDCTDGSVTMSARRRCTATFQDQGSFTIGGPYTLSVGKAGTGSGTITSNRGGINCGIDCSELYMGGTVVNLIVNVSSGSWGGWSGDPDCLDSSVTMNANISCTANINNEIWSSVTIPTQPINGYIIGELWFADYDSDGSLVLQFKMGDIINCGSGGRNQCTYRSSNLDTVHQYVKLYAYPNVNYGIGDWNNVDGSGRCNQYAPNPCIFQFEPGRDYKQNITFLSASLSASPSSGNTPLNNVSLTASNPVNPVFASGVRYRFDCTSDGTYDVDTGFLSLRTSYTTSGPQRCSYASSGTYSARVEVDWLGGVRAAGVAAAITPVTVSVQTHSLEITKSGSGTVTSNPAGINCGSTCSSTFTSGTSVALTASPSAGFAFVGWSGDADCSDGSITVNSDINCTATFIFQDPPLVDIKANGSDGPITISYDSSVTISWTSTDATSCTASASPNDPDWRGSRSTSGSETISNVTTSTTFSLDCVGPGGEGAGSVRVNVLPPDFSISKLGDIFATIIGTHPVTSSSMKITINAFEGFNETVRFSVKSVNPTLNNATYNFSKKSLGPGEYSDGLTFSVTVPPSVAPGLYTIIIEGKNGGLVRNLEVRLNVIAKDPSFKEI